MFDNHDMHSHPFFKGHGHSAHKDFFRDARFNKESLQNRRLEMEHEDSDAHGRLQFFARRGFSGDGSGRFFRRGDFKIILLKLLQEQPRHGYELIKELEEKFQGFYSPSPGSVYPTLQMLEDQDLIHSSKEGRKKVYHLTEEGKDYLKKHQEEDPFIQRMNKFKNVDIDEMQDLKVDIHHLFHAFIKIGRQAMKNPEKKEQLQQLLEKTRTELKKIADENDTSAENDKQ